MPIMNLWAEFDNKYPLAESARRARKQKSTQGRRLTEQVILSSLRDWLLQDYVAPYCRSLAATRIYRRCYWIDALGASTTADREKQVVSLSQELTQANRPIALQSIMLEARRGHSGARINSLPKESGIVRANWPEIAPTLLSFIDQSPAIFLLNPFGQTLFTYDDLAPLHSRTAPTELCLLVSHKQLEARINLSLSTPAGAASLTTLLRTDRWKALINKGVGASSEAQFISPIEGIIDLFIDSMQRHFLSVQRIELPVQVRPTVVETAPYTLVFATRRQDSLASMNDAVCLHRRRLYEQSSRGVLIEEWFVTQQQERLAQQVQQLYSYTIQQGRSQRVRRWPDLRQQLLLTHFGQFTLHEYNQVISKLLLNGEVRCEWRQRPALAGNAENAENTESRIPGNGDTLLWK